MLRMLRSPRFLVSISVLALAMLGTLGSLVPTAHALRAMPVPLPPPPSTEADVRTALAALEPELQQCAAQHPAGSARVMVNVYLFPQGIWSASFGVPRGMPAAGGRGTSPFEVCVAGALEQRIGYRTTTFTGSRPRKVSRRFRVQAASIPTVHVGPPTVGPIAAAQETVVRRLLAQNRAALAACLAPTTPGTARATPTPITFRLELADQRLRLTGVLLPEHIDFGTAAPCLERVVGAIAGPSAVGVLRGEISYQLPVVPAATP